MRLPHRIPPPPHALSLLLSGSLLLCLWLAVSQAQVTTSITSDRTLGTTVIQQGNVYAITGGTRPNDGPNLFHSFDRFSVGTGDIASFRGPQTGITNILSRVTGGQRSDIDGTLRSEIPGANLYLLNPAGVLFGPNASLDISGSFHVSTADYLRLADGARFSARLSDTTTLSVAPPVAFGFLGPQPAPLSVEGSALHVAEEQTLSMVGGDVRIVGGQLVAPGGRIQIASVAAAGEVIPAPTGHAPDLQVDSFMRLGRITLSNALVDASGNGGGLVLVRGGHLLVDNTFMFADNLGPRDGAGLGMDLGITGDAVFTNGSLITADSLGTGRARDLRLTAGSVRLEQGAQIGSLTFGPGQGGSVQVTATDTLTLAGTDAGTGIFAAALGTEVGAGSAGSVIVEAPRIALTEGAQIASSSLGPGQGGSVRVTATDTLTLTGTTPNGLNTSGIFAGAEGTEMGVGNAGSVIVEAPRIALTGGAQISTSTFGPGQGGSVRVIATDTLTLAGDSPLFSSGIFARAGGIGVGAGSAGSVIVEAPRIALTGGAQINSNTRGPGQGGSVRVIATDTLTLAGTTPDGLDPSAISANAVGIGVGAGSAGSVVVEAPRIALTGGAQISSSTRDSGQGGTVRVTATDTLSLVGTSSQGRFPSGIFATAEGIEVGAGNAGSVVVEAPRLALTEGAQISSGTRGPGQGGAVRVTATDTLTLAGIRPDGRGTSGIFATAEGTEVGAGNAGSVVVEAPRLALTEGAQIISTTIGPGQGGSVRVTATDTLTLAGTSSDGRAVSGIGATAQGRAMAAGSAGSVVVEALRLALTGGAQIASSTRGPGQGGTVRVTATDTLTLAGTTPNGLNPSGIFARANGTEVGAGNAGSVVVEAPRVALTGGAQISSSTRGPGQGGTVRVTATDTLTLVGTSPDGTNSSGLFATAEGTGAGAGSAGSVVVDAPRVSLIEGGQIASSTEGPGQGGTVTVTTTDTLTITGRDSSLRTTAASSGRGGDIAVEAREVHLTEGAAISAESSGSGNAGNVTIAASETFRGVRGSVSTAAKEGRGGAITITAASLIDLTTTEVSATVAGGSQPGGDIILTTPILTLTGSRLAAETTAAGPAGSITLNTGTVTAQEATLTSSSTGAATGHAGTVTIQGLGGAGTLPRTVTLTGSTLQTTAEGSGAGGAITVGASDGLQLDHTTLSATVSNGVELPGGPRGDVTLVAPTLIIRGGRLAAETTGTRQAGAITLNVGSLTVMEQAQVTSSSTGAATGNAGIVTIQGLAGTGTAAGTVILRDSAVLTQAVGEGAGGNILVRAGDVTLMDGATISATARGTGPAGEIRLSDVVTLQSTESTVTTEAAMGRGGAIVITAATGMELTRTQVSATVMGGMQPGGDVTLTTPMLRLTGGRLEAETRGAGTAGAITLNVGSLTATEQATLSSSSIGPATGNAGTVTIQGLGDAGTLPRTVTLTESMLQTTAEGSGGGGAITVAASDGLQFDHSTLSATVANGADRPGGPRGDVTLTTPTLTIRGGRLAAETTGTRNAGAITLNVGSLTATEQATLSSSSTGAATGNAGTVTVQGLAGTGTAAGMVTLSDSALLTQAAGEGAGGNILVRAGNVVLTHGATISATAQGTGSAGEIRLSDVATLQSTESAVTTEAVAGRGGAIAMTAATEMELTRTQVSATVTGGTQPGGDVTLTTPVLRLTGGRLEAETRGAGATGAIALNVEQLTATEQATLSSSSTGPAAGDAGRVTIQGFGGPGTLPRTVTLTRSTLQTTAEGTGAGGAITVGASDGLQLDHTTLSATVSNGADLPGSPRGDVTLTAPMLIIKGGRLAAETTGTRHAGAITLNVGSLTVTEQATLSSSSIGLATGDAGTVSVQGLAGTGTAAGTVTLSDSALLTRTAGAGRGGDVVVETGTLTLSEGARLDSSTQGEGSGGTVTVRADATVTLTGPRSGLFTETASAGTGGSLVLEAGALQMREGAQISAASTGTGKAGGIQIRVRDSIQSHNSAVTTAATAGATGGDIAMTAQRFIDLRASDITASVSGGSGTGGNLTLTTPFLRLEGGTLRATTAGAGQGGAIAVDVGQAQLVAGARIDSSTMGTGAGGTVTITAADPVLLTGADTGVFTRSTGAGPGGDIRLTAPRVILSDGATLSAESTGPGNAGNITLTLHDSFMSTRGSVVTRATQADGGNITITAPNLVRLRDSAITAEVGGGPQTVGGNISIDPQFVLLQNSQIVANAFAGQGGTIRIQAQQVFLADPASLVSASSILGIDGQVNIQAPVTSLSGTVVPLPQSFAPTAELLRDRCAARLHEGTVSSLVERGRDGVPASPEGLLPSRLTGTPPPAATPRTAGQRPRPMPAAHYQGGLQHDAAGRLQITNWPTSAASVQVQEVECGTR